MNSKNSSGCRRISRDQCGNGNGARLPLEGVVAYSRRAETLLVKLGRAGRPVPETSLVDDVLDGLIRERPEWQGYLSGVKGALPSTQGGGLKALRPHLGDLENRNEHLSPARAPVLAPAPMAHAAATETAAEARFSRLEEALRRLTSSPQARRPTAAGPTRSCHRCGSTEHLVRHCPHPPLGANPTRPGCFSCFVAWRALVA
jgi:hypothetical protein